MRHYRVHFLLVLFFDACSALLGRQAYNSHQLSFTLLTVISLMFAGYFFMRLMEDEVGIIVNAMWIALGAINVTVASYFLFGEKLTTMQCLGMFIIIVGLILTQYYAPPHALNPPPSAHAKPPS